jgi:site-specific DNA-methyltransferase (adenine-specific)
MKVTDKIEITNEDNMLLMARYPDNYFDLAIVDPPYGNIDAIGLTDNKKQGKQATKRKGYHLFENISPDNKYYLELERVSKNQIIWGGNFLGLCGGVIVWNKNGTAFGEGEIAICSTHKSVQIFEYTWNGMLQGDMKNKETRIHPTQKPVALYKWLLDKYAKIKCDHKHEEHYRYLCTDCNNGKVKILDTHLGSGSIAIACHDYGFDLTACELDKEYFDKAIERIKNHVSQQKLF